MTREQFLLDRKQGLGGSDIAAIMGVSRWKTPLDIYLDKTSEIIEEEKDEYVLQRGRLLEEAVLKGYAEYTGKTLVTNIPMLRHAQYPFLIGNVDAKVQDENILVEAKTSRDFAADWHKNMPLEYKLQAAHYAHIYNADRLDIAVLFGGLDTGYFVYERDEILEQMIKEAAIDFWHNHVLKKVPPPVLTVSDCNALYPKSTKDKIIEANSEVVDLIEAWQSRKQQIKTLEEEEELLAAQVRAYMQDAEILKGNGWKVTNKSHLTNKLDTELLKKLHPSVYTECLKQKQQRPLRFN